MHFTSSCKVYFDETGIQRFYNNEIKEEIENIICIWIPINPYLWLVNRLNLYTYLQLWTISENFYQAPLRIKLNWYNDKKNKMKKYTLITVSFILLNQFVLAQNVWTQKANMGGFVRMGAVGFSIGNKGYLGTGGDFGSVYYNDFWEYDPVLDSWTQKANFPGAARYRTVGFGLGSKGYLGTGYSGTGYNDFWEYDQATNNWTQKANLGGITRFGSAGFTIGNKIYTGTGTGGGGYTKDFWEFDVALNAWTQKANFGGLPKIYAVGLSIGAYGYIGTGVDSANNPLGSQDFWQYDTTFNTWSQKANLPGAGRSEAMGFSIGNYGYIGVGTSNWGVGALADFWKYNPITDSWVQVASFGGGPREEPAGFVINCKAYVGTGFVNDIGGTLTNDLWEYTPDSSFCATGVNFIASKTNVCLGECINFFDISTNTPFAWQWYFPGASITSSNQQNPVNICYPNVGNYDVTFIACNALGCDTLVFQNYIQVNSIPQLSLGADTLICLGDSVLLDAGSGFTAYLWNNGATTQTIYASGQGTYTVEVSSGSCTGLDSLIVSTQACAATVALFSSSDTSFCEKKCLDFTDLSTNNPTSWQWFFPGADSTTSNLQNPVNICYNSYGSFNVTLIACNSAGCDTLSLTNFINEFQGPPVPVITSGNDTLYSTPAYSYQWYYVSTAIPGATNQFYVYQQQGGYYVIITDSNGCATSSNAVYTGIGENLSGLVEILVMPNPSDGNFEIICSGSKRNQMKITVFDALGNVLVKAKPETTNYKINLEKVNQGIYFLEVIADDHIFRKKIMVRN